MKQAKQQSLGNLISRFNRIEEIKSELIGKEISEARRKLGYWWTLDDQTVSCRGGFVYHFSRSAQAELYIHTDRDNIVYDVEGYWFREDSPFEAA